MTLAHPHFSVDRVDRNISDGRIGRSVRRTFPSTPARIVAVAIVLCLVGIVGTPAAIAQSDAQLREENSALRARVRELEVELAAAERRIALLNDRIRELESEKAPVPAVIPEGRGTLPEPPGPRVTIDESSPVASPLTFLRHAQREHAQAQSSFGSYTSPRERAMHMRNLERWVATFNRRHREPIEWVVTWNGRQTAVADRGVTLELTAIDPGSGDALGEPFSATLGTAAFRRLDTAIRRGRDGERLLLRGTLVPNIFVNPQRDRVGSFDSPPFVGTFCEFRIGVEANSLMPLDAAATGTPDESPPERPEKSADDGSR